MFKLSDTPVNIQKRELIKKGILGVGAFALATRSASAIMTHLGDDRVSANNATFNGTDLVPEIDAGILHRAAAAPHSGHAQTIEGQTFTVSDATELNNALAEIRGKIMFGNIDIFYNADITGSFKIPQFVTNGFDVTLKGTLSETLSGAATGGAATVAGTSKGYVEDTGAAWGVNAHRGKILKNPAGDYTSIESNTATRIYYAASVGSFATFAAADVIKVYDVLHSITGDATGETIQMLPYIQMRMDSAKIIHATNRAVKIGDYSTLASRKSIMEGKLSACWIMANSTLNSLGSIYLSEQSPIRLEAATSYYFSRDIVSEKIGGDTLILKTAPSSYKAGIYGLGGVLTFNTCISSVDAKPAGSKGISLNDAGNAIMVFHNIDNFETGVSCVYGAKVRNTTPLITNCTTPYSPSGAADPSYIV